MNKNIIFLSLVSVFLLSLITPFYDLPVNDEAGYVHNVKELTYNGEVEIGLDAPVPTANYIFQIIYGAGIVKLFGFSYGVLRIGIIFISVLGVLGMYKLLKEMDITEKRAMLGSLILLLNPMYYELSHIFMTDVPFVVAMIFSLLFYTKGLKTDNLINDKINISYNHGNEPAFLCDKPAKNCSAHDYNIKFLIIGNLISVISFGIRQTGIFLFLAFALYMILYKRRTFYQKIIVLFVLPSLMFFVISYAFILYHPQTIETSYFNLGLRAHLLVTPLYFGLFLFPFAVLYLLNVNYKNIVGMRTVGVILLLSALIFIPLSYYEKNIRAEYGWVITSIEDNKATSQSWGYNGGLPIYPSIINNIGLGPFFVEGKRDIIFPAEVWALITMLSVISALFLTAYVIGKREFNFVYLVGIILLIFTDALASGIVDRHLLVFLPILIVMFMRQVQDFKYVNVVIIGGLIILGSYSVWGTYDYFEINKAKWKGINYLLDKGVKPEEINGGLEFGMTYLWESSNERLNNNSGFTQAFYYPDYKYAISFEPLNNYSVEKAISKEIYVLKKG